MNALRVAFVSVLLVFGPSVGARHARAARAPLSSTVWPLTSTSVGVEFLTAAHPGGMKIHGTLVKPVGSNQGVQGEIELREGVLVGHATCELAHLDTGIGLRNRHMRDKFLEVEKYPLAGLEFTAHEKTKGQFRRDASWSTPFTGALVLHGVKHPVSGIVTAQNNLKKLEFQFQVPLDWFRIAEPSFMGVHVEKDIKVSVTVKRASS